VAEHALLAVPACAADKSLALVLASQDSNTICEGAKRLWQLPAALFESITITALIIWASGALAGGVTAAIVVTGFAFLYWVSSQMNTLKDGIRRVQDKQVSLFCEILGNIRSFRYYGWDDFFLTKLHGMTDSLQPAQHKLAVLNAVVAALVIAFPIIPSLVIFLISYYTTYVSPSVQFQAVLLSLLNTFRCACFTLFQTNSFFSSSGACFFVKSYYSRYPLWNLPSSLRAVSSAATCYKRLSAFLSMPGLSDTRAAIRNPGAVEVENLVVGPNGSLLQQLHVKPGSLVVLQGPVRSYKSTILKTLAGHLPLRESETVRIGGTISYAPQSPWMCQSSIQDNIVCSEPFDAQRYEDVLHACALTQELADMPLGDQTPVAEKGISLSGGQRQRVALARAAYRRADIYLLDNQLTGLDDSTQQFIWENLIEGLLSTATVIFASSRAVQSCTCVVRLSTNGFESVTVNASGYASDQTPPLQLPNRYRRPNQTAIALKTVHSSESSASEVKSTGCTVDTKAFEDVAADAELFEEYVAATSNDERTEIPVAMKEISSGMLEMGPGSLSRPARASFISLVEQRRESSGVFSIRKSIGSRGVSYAYDAQAVFADTNSMDSAFASSKVLPQNTVQQKSPFMMWIKFSSLNNASLAAITFIYFFYPAVRVMFDQWIGFWATDSVSTDDQFNINIICLFFVATLSIRITMDLLAYRLGALSERNMRKAFCTTVSRAPMNFFMSENLGPLVSVFSRDMSVVGQELMQDFHYGFYYLTAVFIIAIIICASLPIFIPISISVFCLLFMLQKAFSAKSTRIRDEFQQSQDLSYGFHP
jgi:ABC-type multidrug transport system fused ATPase/permease subunit